MKTKVDVGGVIMTSRKDIRRIFLAIEQTGVEINYSDVARKLGVSVSTIYDFWTKFKKRNKVEVLLKVGDYQ